MISDSSSDDQLLEVPDKTKDKYWKRKKELIKEIKELVGTVSSGKNRLNILVLGTTGCGKSSFINTVLTSFREDKWNKYAGVGTTGGTITSVTQHFASYGSYKKYYPEEPNILLPTFIDINGLEDDQSEFNKTFLKLLFQGKIYEEEQITDLLDLYKKNPDEFKRTLTRRPEYLKVDRIIVVTSGDPDLPLPINLNTCIKKISDEVKGIPIFGVMTKRDKFRKNQQCKQKQQDFIKSLGITKDSFNFVENYCPDVDQDLKYHRTVYPFIDAPVLLFMLQVINPRLNRNPEYEVDGYCLQVFIKLVKSLCTLLQIIILTFFLWIFVDIALFGDGNTDFCDKYNKLSRDLQFTLPMGNRCNHEGNRMLALISFVVPIAFSLLLYVFPFCFKRLARACTRTWIIIMSFVLVPIAAFIFREKISEMIHFK